MQYSLLQKVAVAINNGTSKRGTCLKLKVNQTRLIRSNFNECNRSHIHSTFK